MALTNIVRRTASRVVPLTLRAFGSQRCHHNCSTLFAAATNRGGHLSQKLFRSSLPSALHRYSTKSDESLLRVIDSEIECAEEYEVHDTAEGFPFKIEDNPGQRTVTLTREYRGETITVEVHMLDPVTDEDGDEDGDEADTDESELPLVVRVSKKGRPWLEFSVLACGDEIEIDSLAIKDPNSTEDQIAYEGPDFADLDENLQKALLEYLEIRGIKPTTTRFLYDYMLNKDSREYLTWLNNLKKFVEA